MRLLFHFLIPLTSSIPGGKKRGCWKRVRGTEELGNRQTRKEARGRGGKGSPAVCHCYWIEQMVLYWVRSRREMWFFPCVPQGWLYAILFLSIPLCCIQHILGNRTKLETFQESLLPYVSVRCNSLSFCLHWKLFIHGASYPTPKTKDDQIIW